MIRTLLKVENTSKICNVLLSKTAWLHILLTYKENMLKYTFYVIYRGHLTVIKSIKTSVVCYKKIYLK